MDYMNDLGQILSVTTNDDKTVAYLQFLKKDEEFTCTPEVLQHFLRGEGIKFGIQEDIVARFAMNAKEYFLARHRLPLESNQYKERTARSVMPCRWMVRISTIDRRKAMTVPWISRM